jgi:hypothetical protein
MTSRQIVPAIIIPLLAWRVYMRVRRNIGRQHFRPTRLRVSIGIFGLATLAFAAMTFRHLDVLASLAGGLALSIPIALYGLKLTKFEDAPDGKYYTPNTALGIGISALFIGRIVYRSLTISGTMDLQGAATPPPFQSPLTFFLFGLSAGYFIAYQTGVLIRSHQPAPRVDR